MDSAQEGSAPRLHGSTKLEVNRVGLKGTLKPFIALGLEHNYFVKLWFVLCWAPCRINKYIPSPAGRPRVQRVNFWSFPQRKLQRSSSTPHHRIHLPGQPHHRCWVRGGVSRGRAPRMLVSTVGARRHGGVTP